MTPEQIQEKGFTPIESVNHVQHLPEGFYVLLKSDERTMRAVNRRKTWGTTSYGLFAPTIFRDYVGFRHIPDTPAATGFEKRDPDTLSRAGLVEYGHKCNTHIDAQSVTIQQLQQEISELQRQRDAQAEVERLRAAEIEGYQKTHRLCHIVLTDAGIDILGDNGNARTIDERIKILISEQQQEIQRLNKARRDQRGLAVDFAGQVAELKEQLAQHETQPIESAERE